MIPSIAYESDSKLQRFSQKIALQALVCILNPRNRLLFRQFWIPAKTFGKSNLPGHFIEHRKVLFEIWISWQIRNIILNYYWAWIRNFALFNQGKKLATENLVTLSIYPAPRKSEGNESHLLDTTLVCGGRLRSKISWKPALVSTPLVWNTYNSLHIPHSSKTRVWLSMGFEYFTVWTTAVLVLCINMYICTIVQ
jgi:hypothetical protein